MKYLLLLLICMLPVSSHAGQATDMAADPVLEKRMIGLAENLRCLVCQNESLASSHADLAEDLRREVREQMKKGLSDQQIIDYLVSRYGDFVLYDPPVKKSTLILWYGPFVLLLLGIGVLVYQLRKRKSQIVETVLSDEDAQRTAKLLNENPLPNPLPVESPSPQSSGGTTSHSTKPASGQVAGYPASGRGGERERLSSIPAGEGANESLRERHVEDNQA